MQANCGDPLLDPEAAENGHHGGHERFADDQIRPLATLEDHRSHPAPRQQRGEARPDGPPPMIATVLTGVFIA